jgi:hypothetical protein
VAATLLFKKPANFEGNLLLKQRILWRWILSNKD